MPEASSHNRTALYQAHIGLGGRMVPFGGWEMPMQYPTGILAEARAVRSHAGIFDVSHMGRIGISGRDAVIMMHKVLTQNISGLQEGRARYTLLCTEEGGILDDAMVYRLGHEQLFLVCNAANRSVVWQWLQQWAHGFAEVNLQDTTETTVMIALQGPQSPALLELLAPELASNLRPFTITKAQVAGVPALVSRTGYTGEDGFEIVIAAQEGKKIWQLLHQYGASPCGLGARDILRLEASLLLHGTDMDTSTNPLEAGLERFVDLTKESFVGGQALRTDHDKGIQKKLVGFAMVGRGIPRSGYALLADGSEVGVVTSGSYSQTLDKSIGLGYVAVEYAQLGTRFLVDIRGRCVEAEVVSHPFYSRRRHS